MAHPSKSADIVNYFTSFTSPLPYNDGYKVKEKIW